MTEVHRSARGVSSAVATVPSALSAPLESRPMRADAARNHEKILHAAEEIFALDGVMVPIDIVAERAGVGIGTLYRHFPTKEALYEEIVVTRLRSLIETAEECAKDPDAQEGLCSFLHTFAHQASEKKDLFDALGQAGIDIKARFSDMFEELVAVLDSMRQRAVDEGEVRGDVETKDILNLVMGSCHAAGQGGVDGASLQRLVDIVLAGIKASR
ncbi:MAG: TetR/AcrR family transcriptional regulator [Acidimicrobiales bacterium]